MTTCLLLCCMQPTWQVVVPKLALMASPHCEDDAQRYHELSTVHFAPDFDHRRVTRLRICCLQPSPTWREYGLRQLRFYTIEQPVAPMPPPPPSLSPVQRDLAATVLDHLVDLAQTAEQIRQTMAAVRNSRPIAGGYATSRRSANAANHDLAPYLVGEWSDELQLDASHDTPRHSDAHSALTATGAAATAGGTSVMAHTFAFNGGPRCSVPPSSPGAHSGAGNANSHAGRVL